MKKDTNIQTLGSESGISFASIAGAAFSFALIVGAIMLGTRNYRAFLSIEGVMIVVGGTLAVAFMSYQANYVIEALKGIGLMFRKANVTHENLNRNMIDVIAWARIVKQNGLRGLETQIHDAGINDPFVRYGLDMVVSNHNPSDIRSMMETAAEAYYERDTTVS